jgi:undecaprenyl-diphosphatase
VTAPWQGWDEAIFRLVHLRLRHDALDPFFRAFTDPGTLFVPLALILLGALWMRGRRGLLGAVVLALCVAASDQSSASFWKPLFHRARPSVVLPDARPFFGVRGSHSFPSVHASNSFTAALVLDAIFPGGAAGRAVFLGVAGLVSYSRVYVGDHWPSDVVAGALWGALIGWLGRRLYRWLGARFAPDRPRADALAPTRGAGAPNGGP